MIHINKNVSKSIKNLTKNIRKLDLQGKDQNQQKLKEWVGKLLKQEKHQKLEKQQNVKLQNVRRLEENLKSN